jgi:hypothetical protein
MISEEKIRLVTKYSNDILEVIEHLDEFTQSDLQGALEAIVLTILNERK